MGGNLLSAPAVASREEGNITVVAIGDKNQIIRREWTQAGGWDNWTDLAGQATYTPAILSGALGFMTVYQVGGKQNVYRRTWSSTKNWDASWTLTQDNKMSFNGIAAASAHDRRYAMFTLSDFNELLFAECDDSTGKGWGAFTSLGGTFQDPPAAVTWAPGGRVDAFARGAVTSNLLQRTYDGKGNWGGWRNRGGLLASGPAAASWGVERLDVFAKDRNNHVIHLTYDGNGWQPWKDLGLIQSVGSLAAVSHKKGVIDLFARGADNSLWHRTYIADASELGDADAIPN
ncbi:hypothetical protein DMH15_06150 [Streptomyces sp. WAC 06725]|uniref:hypothetical protein n=1 Tax=Streptomyces sp. WAC 06725 TaxID=2203209 RepID=UPI000F739EE3|nr:hypothetical protein [Streptomyces sp. WAC 06725]RSO47590.1 hypothetical protein DMH15_06150 [Streptomyces sp. WAC 06725]